MKKKILFIIPTLKSGGAEKSLVTLLQLFDYDKYDVTLFLFRKEGIFLNMVPENVKIIHGGENYSLFDGDAVNAVKHFLKKGRIDLAFARVLYGLALRKKDGFKKESALWQWLKKSVDYPKGHFDCVIGYLEGTADLLASEIDADKKIGYMHSFLDKTDLDKKYFGNMIDSFDEFVAVSQSCKDNLEKLKPGYKNFSVIHNIISPGVINGLASESVPSFEGGTSILTVGRLSYEKGFDIAVDCCRLLKEKGVDFCWYHIGTGPLKESIEKTISDTDLKNEIRLLGEKPNPYPYIKMCDIYVQPSRHEGKSIAVDEAKALNKPIVVTDFPSVYDQIQHGVNGIICKTNPTALAEGVISLIDNYDLCQKLSAGLSEEKIGNEDEINKLYELIER